MICPHCAFPNELGARVCAKCKRSVDEPAFDALDTEPEPPTVETKMESPPQEPIVQSGPRASSSENVRQALYLAEQHEQNGELREAFLVCQSILIDHPQIADDVKSQIHLTMARISLSQNKPERSQKYMQKARELNPQLPDVNTIETGLRRLPEAIQEPRRRLWAASFWNRLVAGLIDIGVVVVLMLVMLTLSALIIGYDYGQFVDIVAGGLTNLISVFALYCILILIYSAIFTRIGGQTLGQMVFRLKVVGLDGHSLKTKAVILRFLGMILAGLPGLAGFMWAAFDQNRRGWHDRMGGSVVIQLEPPSPSPMDS